MQPETYLLHQVVPPLTIPDLDKLVAPGYERFDFGGMGEFDVYLLAKQYGAKDPPNYYRHWRGGYYFAAQAKTAPKDQIAMLYFTRAGIRRRRRAISPSSTPDYLPKRYSARRSLDLELPRHVERRPRSRSLQPDSQAQDD